MTEATVTCKPCGASAKFVGVTAWQDMVVWDKAHRQVCPGSVAPALEGSSTSETALTGPPIAGNAGYRKGSDGDAQ